MARSGAATIRPLDWGELRSVPNLLSLLRIFLVPPFLGAYLAGQVRLGVVLFAIASVTDLLDGALARLLKQRTELGSLLDPLADKLLGLAALGALVAHARLPAWLLALSLSRDVVVALVAAIARREGERLVAKPSRAGKYATFFTNVAVILALVGEISYARALAGYVLATALVAGEFLTVATIQYAGRFALARR